MIFPGETLKKACSVCSGFGYLLRERRGLRALCHAGLRGGRGVRAAAARSLLAENGTCAPGARGRGGAGRARGRARRPGAGLLRAPVHFLRARPGVLRDGGGRQCPCAPASRISAATERARAEGPGPAAARGSGARPAAGAGAEGRSQPRARPRARRWARAPLSPCPRARPRTARGAVGVARAVPGLSHRRRQDFSVLEETRIKHGAESSQSAVAGPRGVLAGGCLRSAVGAF